MVHTQDAMKYMVDSARQLVEGQFNNLLHELAQTSPPKPEPMGIQTMFGAMAVVREQFQAVLKRCGSPFDIQKEGDFFVMSFKSLTGKVTKTLWTGAGILRYVQDIVDPKQSMHDLVRARDEFRAFMKF
jgi:hypothetical protein